MHETENRIHSNVGNGRSVIANMITKMPLAIPHIPAIKDTIFFVFILIPYRWVTYFFLIVIPSNTPTSSPMLKPSARCPKAAPTAIPTAIPAHKPKDR